MFLVKLSCLQIGLLVEKNIINTMIQSRLFNLVILYLGVWGLVMGKKSGKKQDRSRNYQFIVYPNDIRKDWKNILQSFCAGYVISPLHDKDYKEDENGNKTDELKKPHYHVLVCFNNPRYIIPTKIFLKEQLMSFADKLLLDSNDKSYQEAVLASSVSGLAISPNDYEFIVKGNEGRSNAVRYFDHRDHPDKAQYNIYDCESFGTLSVWNCIKLNDDEIRDSVFEIMDIIDDENITEFFRLAQSLRYSESAKNGDYTLFDILSKKRTLFFNAYLTSRRNYFKQEIED